MTTVEIIFWMLALLIFYTYLGYGMVLYGLVALKRMQATSTEQKDFEGLPSVTLIIPAYNEMDYLPQKVKNCQQLIYPQYQLDIIFVTDGSDDGSYEYLQSVEGIQAFHQNKRAGKTAAMNRIVSMVDTAIVVFTDANAMLNQMSILNMVQLFDDPTVGCVSGEKKIIDIQEKAAAATAGEGLYWKYESKLKTWSSEWNSVIGAVGELFAIRRTLFEAPAQDTLLDDFMISTAVVKKGYRIAYCSDAIAIESGSSSIAEELKRKVRICTGGLQSIWRSRQLLHPFHYPAFAFQFVSHRVLRWTITPIALLLVFPINAWLAIQVGSVYSSLFAFQLLFYFLAIVGWQLSAKEVKIKVFFVPFYFMMMNYSVFGGFLRLWTNNQSVLWEKTQRLSK